MTATTAAQALPPASARGTMPLAGHMREARRRGVRAAVALSVCVVVGFMLSDSVLDVLRTPIEQLSQERQASLNYDTVTGAFDLKLKISLFSGIVLSSPAWLFELFGFVVPGMTTRERKYAAGFVLSAVPLFLSGCAFGLALFPHMMEVLTGFSADEDTTILTASYYVDFVMKFVLAIGVAFVLPVLLVVLNFLGLLPASALRRGWRTAVVAITLFSALVTPAADVLSMFFVAAPMVALFALALFVAHTHDRRTLRRAVVSETATQEPQCSD